MKKAVIINPKDNVEVLLEDFEGISAGHKLAIKPIKKGECIIKYGVVIGRASEDINVGEWVHTHNVKSHLDEEPTYSYNPVLEKIDYKTGTFLGFKRKYGNAGIRNNIYIIPTVGCVNNVVKEIEKRSQEFVRGSIDSIVSLTHQFGCSQLGEDNENIKKLLCSIALNPNATYAIFVGLGCENNSLQGMKDYLAPYGRDNIFYFNSQEVEDEVEYGVNLVKELAVKAAQLVREPVDLSELVIGLKCGGSDGFSGITANPTVGMVSDKLVSYGGSSILTEVPEMFGAEQLLMNKCASKDVYDKYVKLINNFKRYYLDQGFPVYENPSPGNKKGGITTLEEKSCGCITKAGSTPIQDVLDYAEQVKAKGVSALNGPGNDLIAATALAASGAQVVLFTTGRGTPFSTFVPTLKIGTNNHISSFKDNWIDFNAYTLDAEGLWNLLLDTCNGKYRAKSEDYKEIAFYKKGVTL